MRRIVLLVCIVALIAGAPVVCRSETYDVLIRSGRIYDGSGGPAYTADVGIKDDRIAAVGQLSGDADRVVDARGLAVAPGFINMLSWANDCLLEDGRSQSGLLRFRSDRLKHLTGKTLAEVAHMRGKTAAETAIDLVVEDDSRVGAVYFLMSEENVKKQIALPWVSFCSDTGSLAPEGVFLQSNPHPRAYGNFARLLGRYVRREKVVALEEAIRRLTSLPAENLKLDRRGRLAKGHYADVVVFDPATIADHATYEKPHQYATGMIHVFVNGTQVLKNGAHTGAAPGRVVRGPGWKGRARKSKTVDSR